LNNNLVVPTVWMQCEIAASTNDFVVVHYYFISLRRFDLEKLGDDRYLFLPVE
jgi:hypothetical protein